MESGPLKSDEYDCVKGAPVQAKACASMNGAGWISASSIPSRTAGGVPKASPGKQVALLNQGTILRA